MGRRADIALGLKNDILKALASGKWTIDAVACHFGVSKRSVQRIKKTGVITANRVGRCGPKRKTSMATDRRICRLAASNPNLTLSQHATILSNVGVTTSRCTIHRRLTDKGFRSVVPLRKPRLTAKMRKDRLQWAKQHSTWTSEDWRRVCFSDESSFQCQDAGGRRVWQRPGTPKPTTPTVKFPTKVMVWSVMSYHGTGRLHVIEGTMNAIRSDIDVLDRRLLPKQLIGTVTMTTGYSCKMELPLINPRPQ